VRCKEAKVMSLRARARFLAMACPAVLLLAGSQARGEDLRQRWYFGGNLSYLSTIDDVRNNAAIIFTEQYGDDNIPFTGDPNEIQGCGQFGSDTFGDPFCDPRPDDLLERDNKIEETFYGMLTAGYGLTSWLNLQVDVGYFEGEVGPVDVFLRDVIPVTSGAVDPNNGPLTRLIDRQISEPAEFGTIREIPITLSGIVRFRKDSPLNPYIGVGLGVVFTDVDVSQDIDELNERLDSLRLKLAGNEFGKQISDSSSSGNLPQEWFVEAELEDAFQWHLNGGVEYFFNDRFSMIFDARYAFVNQDVTITLGGFEDQVDFILFPETFFRDDGSVQIFAAGGSAPNTTCAEAFQNIGTNGYTMTRWDTLGCDPANPNEGNITPNAAGGGCASPVDFDGDGNLDRCYTNLSPSPSGQAQPKATLVVQTGDIDLTAFSVAVGARIHF
jgi:opacity protein-like surface antigen